MYKEKIKMIDIGTLKNVKKYQSEQMLISETMEQEGHNSIVFLVGSELDHTQNEEKILGVIPYAKWRVIGAGLLCTEATTDNEAGIVHFGVVGDVDNIAVITITATASKGMQIAEYTSKDQYSILPTDDLATDDLVVTWTTPGTTIWNTWQTTIKRLQVKSIASVTTGKWVPYVVIEVDASGKF